MPPQGITEVDQTNLIDKLHLNANLEPFSACMNGHAEGLQIVLAKPHGAEIPVRSNQSFDLEKAPPRQRISVTILEVQIARMWPRIITLGQPIM